MDRETLKSISSEQYQEFLEANLEGQIHFVTNPYKGHATELHCGMSDIDMIERIMKEGKQRASTFYSEETLNICMEDAIYYKAEEIAVWMTKSRNEFTSTSEYLNYSATIKMTTEPIGTGITSDFKEKESSYMTFVLCRDLEEDSPFGFFLKTAYVDITEGKGEYTGKEWNKDIVYKEQDLKYNYSIDKLCDIAKREYPDFYVCRCNNKNNETEIKIMDKKSKDNIYIAYIGKNDSIIKNLTQNGSIKIPYSLCLSKNTNFAEAVLNIENYKNEIVNHKIEHAYSETQGYDR